MLFNKFEDMNTIVLKIYVISTTTDFLQDNSII